MDALEQVTLTGNVFVRALRASVTPPLALVVLVVFAVPAAVTLALAGFAHPVVSPLAVPAVRALGGEPALHYPGNFVLLPGMLARLGRATAWLALPLALAWAGLLAAYGRRGISAFAALATTVQRLAPLVAFGAPLAFLHGTATAMSADMVVALGPSVGVAAHLLATLLLESAVLGVCAVALPVLIQVDVPLTQAPILLKRALRHGTLAPFALGVALALSALLGRIVFTWQVHALAGSRPEAVVLGSLEAALCTALGLVVLALGSVTLAVALDEGWRE